MVLSGKVKGALVKEGHGLGLAEDAAVVESCQQRSQGGTPRRSMRSSKVVRIAKWPTSGRVVDCGHLSGR